MVNELIHLLANQEHVRIKELRLWGWQAMEEPLDDYVFDMLFRQCDEGLTKLTVGNMFDLKPENRKILSQ